MNLRVAVVLLGFVVCASCRPLGQNVTLPLCDSPEAEAAAQASLDFITAQQKHGYKYALNQIEDIRVVHQPDGTQTYLVELEFLETTCHVFDPTPVSQCNVRPKILTAVEADCDVALSEAGGQFNVIAFKCKTELERPDFPCAGCINILPLNDTEGNQLVQNSLQDINRDQTYNATFDLVHIGRLSSQIVGGGAIIRAEYTIFEHNCTSPDNAGCHYGFCHASRIGLGGNTDCKIYSPNNGIVPVPGAGSESPSTTQGFTHHKLTTLHDPAATGLLSAESESAEKAPIVKRTVVDPQLNGGLNVEPQPLLPRCPGKLHHF